jgi:RimJ/RimL family protein N-acetyltransferase
LSVRLISGSAPGAWVAGKTRGVYIPQISQAIGLERDGQIVAGVIFTEFNAYSCVVHIAIEGRISPQFLYEVSRYAFVQCGLSKIVGPVDSDNEAAIRLDKKLGFIEEGRLTGCAPSGGDIILFTMRRDQCRFLEGKYGKIRNASAAA